MSFIKYMMRDYEIFRICKYNSVDALVLAFQCALRR